MPEVSSSVFITIILVLFSAGVTWGVMTARSKTNDTKLNSTISDLKEAVHELKGLATELQVMKASSARSERDVEKHESRITALEIAVAKLQDRKS